MKSSKVYWRPGERVKLSQYTNISVQHLSDILHRRRGVSKERAILLEAACKKLFKQKILFRDWLFNLYSDHPAFFGKPLKPKKLFRSINL